MLQTRDAPKAGSVVPAEGVDLARARAHEFCGPSRRLLALLTGAAMKGPVLWLLSTWETERLNGDGVAGIMDPCRLVSGSARTWQEILRAAEDALRSGAVPLVVAELAAPPGLTPVRRLHLAAEEGARSGSAPLMLLLTPEDGGAPGVETRWHMAQRPDRRWLLTRSRARMAPPQSRELTLRRGRMCFTEPARETQGLQNQRGLCPTEPERSTGAKGHASKRNRNMA